MLLEKSLRKNKLLNIDINKNLHLIEETMRNHTMLTNCRELFNSCFKTMTKLNYKNSNMWKILYETNGIYLHWQMIHKNIKSTSNSDLIPNPCNFLDIFND